MPVKVSGVPCLVSLVADAESRGNAARTTSNEFAALAIRLRPQVASAELKDLPQFTSLSQRVEDPTKFRNQLVNGWNTERILGMTAEVLTQDALSSGLQWAFPMAYYATYSVTVAYFKAVGFTESSHTAVIRKFGSLVALGKYPSCMSFFADGPRPCAFCGVQYDPTFSTLARPTDPETADKIICSFLSGTRKLDLEEKKKDLKLLTKAGKRKQAFDSEDWAKVSEKLGRTSLLSLLYRKRIKANYRDIDTFLSPQIDAVGIFRALQLTVNSINLVHEAFVARLVGRQKFEHLLAAVPRQGFKFVRRRYEVFRDAI